MKRRDLLNTILALPLFAIPKQNERHSDVMVQELNNVCVQNGRVVLSPGCHHVIPYDNSLIDREAMLDAMAYPGRDEIKKRMRT